MHVYLGERWQYQVVPGLRAAPAWLLGAQQLTVRIVQLQPLFAALTGDAAIQRHVAVVRLRGLINGQLGFL